MQRCAFETSYTVSGVIQWFLIECLSVMLAALGKLGAPTTRKAYL
jgi:hypothetical protein